MLQILVSITNIYNICIRTSFVCGEIDCLRNKLFHFFIFLDWGLLCTCVYVYKGLSMLEGISVIFRDFFYIYKIIWVLFSMQWLGIREWYDWCNIVAFNTCVGRRGLRRGHVGRPSLNPSRARAYRWLLCQKCPANSVNLFHISTYLLDLQDFEIEKHHVFYIYIRMQ